MRFAGVALLAILLVIAGIAIRANFWPRIVRVEQRVVAPAVNAIRARSGSAPLADMIAGACPAVVSIQSVVSSDATNRRAGFLVSTDGYVVTAARLLPASGVIRVLLNDGRSLDAVRAGIEPASGIALLKVSGSDFPALQFVDAALPRIGDSAVALASPNGTGCIAEPGIVGADFVAEGSGLESYARLRPAPDSGFAGSPVLNEDGHVIGVVGLAGDDGDDDGGRLLPAGLSNQVISDLMRGDVTGAGAFGIMIENLTPALAERVGVERDRGAMVSLVRAGSPADRAGLRAGDVIFAASDTPIGGGSELARALDTTDAWIQLDVMRRAERLRIVLRTH